MEFGPYGSESQDSDEPVQPGLLSFEDRKIMDSPSTSNSLTSRGVDNAKKKLRAFSIHKRVPVPPVTVVKPVGITGNTTVLIGKLSNVKVTPKPEKPLEDDPKKPPKPPKPGGNRQMNESYIELQRKTLSEIEDMKRKMELVELGIPLGLVCPSTNALPVKAMPTKAMPPIKTFLDTAKIDEIIREARKAKAEGKEFKFDYQKFVPDYDNPFQRKKDVPEYPAPVEKQDLLFKKEEDYRKGKIDSDKRDRFDKDRRKSDRFAKRYDYRKDGRDKYRDKDRHREKDKRDENRSRDREDKSRERDYRGRDKDDRYGKDDKIARTDNRDDIRREKVDSWKDQDLRKDETIKEVHNNEVIKNLESSVKDSDKPQIKETKETDVNLNDYLVCDSWSLETEDKNSPRVDDKTKKIEEKSKKDPIQEENLHEDPLLKVKQNLDEAKSESPKPKMEKLKPVIDSFKFEIDPNDDEILDIFDEDSSLDKFAKTKSKSLYLPVQNKFDSSNDNFNEEKFLESVINEIKHENMSDNENENNEKSLVEYDESPLKDSNEPSTGSVTPELDDSIRLHSQRSDYSDGIKSTDSRKSFESGYKSTESGYKSTESGNKSTESGCKSAEKKDKDSSLSYNSLKDSSSKLTESDEKSGKVFKTDFKRAESETKTEKRPKEKDSKARSIYDSSESICKSDDSSSKSKNRPKGSMSMETDQTKLDVTLEAKMSEDTVESLETWSFVLKICQPLLFRHDKNKCYKETNTSPKLWYTQNPRVCSCVADRSVVYEELEMCKKSLVNLLCHEEPLSDSPIPIARTWYPPMEKCLVENPAPLQLTSEWDMEDGHLEPSEEKKLSTTTPEKIEEVSLDREYQRFMEAVWPEVTEARSLTPVRDSRKASAEDRGIESKRGEAKKAKLCSEEWSQESDVEESEKTKPPKAEKVKEKRKRKHSPATLSSESDDEDGPKKRKKNDKKKNSKKAKAKATKRRKIEKKMLKKLKEKKKKKKAEKAVEESVEEEEEKEPKKKDKKVKKKKKQKLKKKSEKKKKRVKSTSSSTDVSSSDSSESSSESDRKAKKKKKEQEVKKKKKEKKKKRKQSSSDSAHSEELFDANILKNIKTERLTDDEKKTEDSPVKKHREIVNVKELQDDFSNVQIKQEVQEESKRIERESQSETQNETEEIEPSPSLEEDLSEEVVATDDIVEESVIVKDSLGSETEHTSTFDLGDSSEQFTEEKVEKVVEFKLPDIPSPPPRPDESSQCSSQESISSIASVKEQAFEKDESHLRPSCDNSNYSFNDVISSQASYKSMEDTESYENYEIYEQMAMAYQSDVASQQISPPSSTGEQRIETVVRARQRGEIKCDWRASDGPAVSQAQRPSRWGLKPGEVNIVLTGGSESEMLVLEPLVSHPLVSQPLVSQPLVSQPLVSQPFVSQPLVSQPLVSQPLVSQPLVSQPLVSQPLVSQPLVSQPIKTTPEPVYKIQSLAKRGDNSMSYDEAYMDTYGAADRLQYGDCFSAESVARPRSLDDRINRALRETVLGEVAKDENAGSTEKGILVMKSLSDSRGTKRVSFADGYKPGQDSDVEEPPARKRKKLRRVGCAWPCPATHADHVPLWDALPPPPPPPGSPPPVVGPPPPLHLLRQPFKQPLLTPPPHVVHKFDPSVSIPNFMPPEPPPGLISFP